MSVFMFGWMIVWKFVVKVFFFWFGLRIKGCVCIGMGIVWFMMNV